MSAQSTPATPPKRSPLSRFFRAMPIIGRVIRDVERDIDTIFYVLVVALTAVILAVQTWGLAALVVTAVALVPVMFVLLIWVTLP